MIFIDSNGPTYPASTEAPNKIRAVALGEPARISAAHAIA